MNDVLDDTEVAAILDCEPSTVREKARKGELPAIKPGRSWRFPRVALLQKLNEMALENKPTRIAPAAVQATAPEKKTRRCSPPSLAILAGQPSPRP